MNDRVRYAIVIVVTVMWVANNVARFVIDGYEPSVGIDGVFGMIVGSLFLAGGGGEK